MKGLNILIITIIYFSQSINCQHYVPAGRFLHTATLIGTKIYFLGGAISVSPRQSTNDFFYLDISKSFNKSNPLPLVDLKDKALELPPHYAATATTFGELKDSIFFFGGVTNM